MRGIRTDASLGQDGRIASVRSQQNETRWSLAVPFRAGVGEGVRLEYLSSI